MVTSSDFDSTWDARILYYAAFLRGVVTYGREFDLEWKQFHYNYLNCHTDITIPYDELDKITVIRKDGTTEDIIADGRFVLAGTEALNGPLDR